MRVLYGDNHPYGYIELVPSHRFGRQADDLANFSQQTFVPNDAALVIAGPISQAEVKALAEKTFGSSARGAPAAGASDTFTTAPCARAGRSSGRGADAGRSPRSARRDRVRLRRGP